MYENHLKYADVHYSIIPSKNHYIDDDSYVKLDYDLLAEKMM